MVPYKEILSIMGIIGIPSVFTLSVACFTMCIKFYKTLNYIMGAIKSDIRSDLLKDFETYSERGWVSDIELQEWCNRYKSYHNLIGENGVLDDRYDRLIKFPNHK